MKTGDIIKKPSAVGPSVTPEMWEQAIREDERRKIQKEVSQKGFEGIKSGRKVAKKLKQYYGRELRQQAGDRIDKTYKTFEEHVRPKPKYIPTSLWKTLQRIVLMHYV